MTAVAPTRSLGITIGRLAGSVYLLLVAHVLWLAGTLLGAAVAGVGPATAALYRTLEAHRRDEHVSARDAARTFRATYRRTFRRANGLALVLLAGAAAVIAGSAVVHHLPPIAALLCRAAFLCAVLSIGLIALMAGPAVSRFGYPGSPLALMRLALLYAVIRFPVVLLGALCGAAVAIAVWQIPALVLAVGLNVVFATVMTLDRVGRIR